MSTKNQPFFSYSHLHAISTLCPLYSHFFRRTPFYLSINLTRNFILGFYISPSMLPASLPPLSNYLHRKHTVAKFNLNWILRSRVLYSNYQNVLRKIPFPTQKVKLACTTQARPCTFYPPTLLPATDEPPLEHPGKQILPCDCSRSHIFLTQLDTINEEDPKTKGISAFSSTSDALKREFDSFQFHYYLPHISDHGVNFYSDQGFVAYYLGNFGAELDLPVIENGDFEYYPNSPQASSCYSQSMATSSGLNMPLTRETVSLWNVPALTKKVMWLSKLFKSVKGLVTRLPPH